MKNQSEWMLDEEIKSPALTQDTNADVLIIGGGITGVTSVYLLSKSGKSVVLLEKAGLAGAETLHTTAHISYPTDVRLGDLIKDFGRDHAQAVWRPVRRRRM
jgi:glycine/D-amino acid oxidase-like deaminating enzyme